MNARISGALIGVALMADCSLAVDDPTPATLHADVTVTTSANVYRWDDGTVDATLSNIGSQPYYARLGDAFSAEEQDVLFAANGSDGYLERLDGGTWVSADRASLIEGVRFVVLNPNTTYVLQANLTGPNAPGTYRLRVDYFDSVDGGTKVGEAVSNQFVIR
jgi:hypothetical protein